MNICGSRRHAAVTPFAAAGVTGASVPEKSGGAPGSIEHELAAGQVLVILQLMPTNANFGDCVAPDGCDPGQHPAATEYSHTNSEHSGGARLHSRGRAVTESRGMSAVAHNEP